MVEEFLYLLWQHVLVAMQPLSGHTKTQSRYKGAHSMGLILSAYYMSPGESNGNLPLRICPGCSVPEPYRSPD